MINGDGFILSHMIEPIKILDAETVKKYLPTYAPQQRLHPDNPITMGCFAMPNLFSESKKSQEAALINSMPTIKKAFDAWSTVTLAAAVALNFSAAVVAKNAWLPR